MLISAVRIFKILDQIW